MVYNIIIIINSIISIISIIIVRSVIKIYEVKKMLEVKTKLCSIGTSRGVIFPQTMMKDSAFPFKSNQKLRAKIVGKRIMIEGWWKK
jgi:hypothetical protein